MKGFTPEWLVSHRDKIVKAPPRPIPPAVEGYLAARGIHDPFPAIRRAWLEAEAKRVDAQMTSGVSGFHVLPYPPSANNYWRSIVINGSVRVVVSREAKAFKRAVSAALSGISPIAGPVSLTMTFYRPRKRGDLDNLLKVTIDSMKGIAFYDDNQVERIDATRKEDKENPRVEIALRKL